MRILYGDKKIIVRENENEKKNYFLLGGMFCLILTGCKTNPSNQIERKANDTLIITLQDGTEVFADGSWALIDKERNEVCIMSPMDEGIRDNRFFYKLDDIDKDLSDVSYKDGKLSGIVLKQGAEKIKLTNDGIGAQNYYPLYSGISDIYTLEEYKNKVGRDIGIPGNKNTDAQIASTIRKIVNEWIKKEDNFNYKTTETKGV